MTELNFKDGHTPIVQKGNMKLFIVLAETVDGIHSGHKAVFPAFYLNKFPLEHYEGCDCQYCSDEDYSGDGMPSTGWYSENSDFDFEIGRAHV